MKVPGCDKITIRHIERFYFNRCITSELMSILDHFIGCDSCRVHFLNMCKRRGYRSSYKSFTVWVLGHPSPPEDYESFGLPVPTIDVQERLTNGNDAS